MRTSDMILLAAKTPQGCPDIKAKEVETGKNICIEDEETEKIVNDLSKAVVVRELVDSGMSLADAIRELARRMRRLQQGI